MGTFDTTRPRLQYTRPAPGPNPFPSEGAGDPNGDRFGGHYSLYCEPFEINEVWVYQDGAAPQCTYSTGHIIPNGSTVGRSWEKETRSVDSITDDTLANFEQQWLVNKPPPGQPVVSYIIAKLVASTRPLSIRWQVTLVNP